MQVLYNIAIKGLGLGLKIASLFNSRAKQWIQLRKDYTCPKRNNDAEEIYLFHAASVGEYEQAKPLIKSLKQARPQARIVLSLFSPSTVTILHKNPLISDYFYLPLDTYRNAEQWIKNLKPNKAFWIKYEFWWNTLTSLKSNGCETYLVSAHFTTNSIFSKSYGAWYRKKLSVFKKIFVQESSSKIILEQYGIPVWIAGDTRYDTVLQTSEEAYQDSIIEQFIQNKRVLIAGSTWPKDEELLSKCLQLLSDWHLIIAPHNVNENNIGHIEYLFGNKCTRYSNAKNDAQVMIIDQTGILKKLYRYATVAYVGGGFDAGVHNTLEALVYGCTVFIGPNHARFQEVQVHKSAGFIKEVNGAADLAEQLTTKHISPPIIAAAIAQEGGATQQIGTLTELW